MDDFGDFTDQSVFITGASGFVGSHLVEKLVDLEAEVHVFIRSNEISNLQDIDPSLESIEIHRGDLTDSHSIRTALKRFPDGNDSLLFHLGAQAHVGESWERPYETVRTNIDGTLSVLQSIVDLDLDFKSIITAGTSEEYGNAIQERISNYVRVDEGRILLNELSPVNPESIYATSKLAADFLTMNYHAAYGIPGIVTRMFNNFGPRQNPRFITGTVITQALTRETVEVGNLSSMRDMTYIADGVRAYLHVALSGKPGERYVYGQGQNTSMKQWVDLIIAVGESKGYWSDVEITQSEDRFRPGETDVQELLVDHSKLTEATGWVPAISWEEGIEKNDRLVCI